MTSHPNIKSFLQKPDSVACSIACIFNELADSHPQPVKIVVEDGVCKDSSLYARALLVEKGLIREQQTLFVLTAEGVKIATECFWLRGKSCEAGFMMAKALFS